jgi:hypothetical protein
VAFTGSVSSRSGSACPPFAIVLEPMAHQWLTFDRQLAEFQVRVAVLSGFTALGIPVTDVAGQVCPGKGEARSADDVCDMHNRPLRKRYLQSWFWRVIGCGHVSGL